MKAVIYSRIGSARDVLQVVDLADPLPREGEVRVRLHCSGINPSDVKRRAGSHHAVLPYERQVPHSDGAGVIDQVGAGVDAGRIGERVWVWNAAYERPDGTAAEYVVLPQAQAVALPKGVSFEAGACLGVPAMTALQAVMGYGGVAGKSVLVAGGAGAVGHYAIQFCRLLGARQVFATVSSPEKAAIARAAGADAAIDYRTEDVADRARQLSGGLGVDRVIEVDLAKNLAANARLLRRGGEVVAYGSSSANVQLTFPSLIAGMVSLHFFLVYALQGAAREAVQAELTRLLAGGKVQHRIGQRFGLAQVVEAHETVEAGRAEGNLVLAVGPC